MKQEQKLKISLALIRFSTGIFFLVWSLEKFISPENAQKIFSKFYFMEISPAISQTAGIVQTIIVLAFMAGLLKTWTYGAILGMHAVSTFSTYQQLLNPYETSTSNKLFWAAVPLLAALIGLFLMRKEDNLLSITFDKK
ncbi:conserved membrane hypothetical protein [Hyella patelloides LEGE 07179]|uniref:DoxX protein n=1 Tax=Hyella patelloides LEGE 07179 TaxID=945734 RepID=A0A563W0C5_9CYAN|nr:DoxX protein [Hyella patelloides]VEP16973.1 conserved membrane hypothetical protein [Hyella patelloides LEGE 07179]